MSIKELSVRLNGKPVGILRQVPSGRMNFNYDKNASQAISIRMPISDQTYDEWQCEAFFGGLLPENPQAKMIIGKQFGANHNNSFALLKAIGHDCAGAISFHALNEPVVIADSIPLQGKVISDDELYNHIIDLPKKPLFLGLEGLRLSLAGMQDKAAVCMIDGKVALSENNCPTTHILKPSSAAFEGIVENEYFSLKLAKHVGLTVPQVEIRQVKDMPYLLVERYDRKIKANEVQRIHQEDFCQALGIVSADKYQRDGGPGFKEGFDLLQKTARPAIDRNMLAVGVVFNFLISNMDAHGKNFSLLHNQSGIELAPFYDLVCTRVYPHLTHKMAMKIGSKYDCDMVFPENWEQLCTKIQYSYPAMRRLINQLANTILIAANKEKQSIIDLGGNISVIEKIIPAIEKQINKTVGRFEKG